MYPATPLPHQPSPPLAGQRRNQLLLADALQHAQLGGVVGQVKVCDDARAPRGAALP